ncbi:hypothetical protein Ahy_A06g027658 [Arachis hypogaea]|uniref:Uncharacterized protein n=1 Tax=Arachis hypogaea TaxID=3818 RepID=A0A445CPF2_ARAHY|nr:hypothetical protein Ahy_A06g027658 [Arachis hypogaea]
MESEYIRMHHNRHQPLPQQCSSALVKHIKAPAPLVWSLVRRFDQPQKYKPFVSRCTVHPQGQGDLAVGSLRQVNVKSGLPATTSTERLEQLDDHQQSFVVDVPDGNTVDETCYFVEALIRCNLSSLATATCIGYLHEVEYIINRGMPLCKGIYGHTHPFLFCVNVSSDLRGGKSSHRCPTHKLQ